MRPVCFSMRLSTQMSGLTCVLSLYVIRSNSPSGGMKEMVRSFSKRASLTHWWNLMSSKSTDFPCLFRLFCICWSWLLLLLLLLLLL
jgi:hypothetical protein